MKTYKALAEVIGVLQELLEEKSLEQQLILPTVWKSKIGIKGKYRDEQKKNT